MTASYAEMAKGVNVVIDTTWGDGGKGKLVDLLAVYAHLVVRYAGGDNAGHSIKNRHGEFKMHIMPSGIFNRDAINVLGDGVVLNPWRLVGEMTALREAGFDISNENLLISEKAQLIMPWHIERDGLGEKARGRSKIGTTGRGIGPAYSDRTAREGLRVGDLLNPDLEHLVLEELEWQEYLVRKMDGEPLVSELFRQKFWRQPLHNVREMVKAIVRSGHFDKEKILGDIFEAREMLAPMITNTVKVVRDAVDQGKNVLGEGAQGSLLDIDHGNHPYVTSSNPGRIGFERSTTIDPKDINHVYGVTKAFATRVGEGPMPTELPEGPQADVLRQMGTAWAEVGTTTGRLRRVGWLDTVQARWGADFGGATDLAITKVDCLDTLSRIPICVAYKLNGQVVTDIRGITTRDLFKAEPVYEYIEGWRTSTRGVQNYDQLPQQAKRYLERASELIQKPLGFISTGPGREEMIIA